MGRISINGDGGRAPKYRQSLRKTAKLENKAYENLTSKDWEEYE